MSSIITNINRMITELPERDIEIGRKYIEERDFNSLYELVDSAIVLAKKDRALKTNKYNICLDKLEQLKSEITLYLEYLKLPDLEEEYNECYIKDSWCEEY